MNAIVYDRHASPMPLVFQAVENPVPKANEVLIQIHAVSINAADYRSMKMGIIPKRKIFGADVSGIVVALGPDCHTFAIGDEVFGDLAGCGFGGFAEFAVAPESLLARKPSAIGFVEAAALPMASVTALQGLRDLGKLQPGQNVLIYGAGGGVGTFAVQLAKVFGARVTAVCSGKNSDRVRALGADEVLDYDGTDFAKTGARYDLILAVNGHHSLATYRRCLKPEGKLIVVGGDLRQVLGALLFGPFLSIGRKKCRTLAAKPSGTDLAYIAKLVEDGRIHPVLDRQYALPDTVEAMNYLSQGHAQGKVVITVTGN